jgi:hypothetical protein
MRSKLRTSTNSAPLINFSQEKSKIMLVRLSMRMKLRPCAALVTVVY